MLTRRQFIHRSIGSGLASIVPFKSESGDTNLAKTFLLNAVKSAHQIVPEQYGKTDVWCFDHSLPGPEIRVTQGDIVRILVTNSLDEETTVHWHGIRLANAMDGVPHLTQAPIAPGDSFLYEFTASDAGTFWYHPHQRSFEQVGRGLYGALVVEEPNPIQVDRELVWVLDDWQLERTAQLSDRFGDMHDISHAGQIGNTVTINGKLPDQLKVSTGERLRIRLVNAANARVFGLEFESHNPQIIAIDGHPVTPHTAENEQIVIAPGMRVDLVLDCVERPETMFSVVDRFYSNQAYKLINLSYGDAVIREHVMDSPIQPPPNPVAEPETNNAVNHVVELTGGARGTMEGAMLNGHWHDLRSLVHNGKAWAINGIAASGHVMDPLVTLDLNQTCILDMLNDTAWHHPMHLHGHTFRVLTRNGNPGRYQEWQDTVLMDPGERVEIAFVADNPGDWMFHCHVLEHQAGGMMGVVRVG